MFEKFTDRSRQVVVLAQEEARLLAHNYIGTEHLLLGLIDQGDGLAADALASCGLLADRVRAEIETIGRGPEPPGGHIPFTPMLKQSLAQAMREALRHGDGTIGTEHLLLGLLRREDNAAVKVITALGGDPSQIRDRVLELSAKQAPVPPEAATTLAPPDAAATTLAPSPTPLRVPPLERYARLLKPGPVVARDAEIERLRQVLSRRTRNNAILVGEAGAGRRAVAEGLGRQLYEVDFALIAAGAADRGEAEWRVVSLLHAIRSRRAIVLTAELSPFEGLPGEFGPLLGAFVRAALERQELQLISTATPAAYRDLIARDPRLAAVVQAVEVSTPGAAAAVEMVTAARPRLEEHHHVRIPDPVVELAVGLATGTLPASAIDLLDEACSRRRGDTVDEEDVRAAL